MITTYTVASYKTWVRGRLRGITVEDALLTEIADSTNKSICHEAVWPFMETEYDGTAASGTRSYNLGVTIADFQLSLGLLLTDPNNRAVDVTYLRWRQFDELYPDPDQLVATTPTVWTLFGSTLYIGPAKMDQTYTFRLPYIKEPTALTTDGQVVNIPDAFKEVLILGMLMRALEAKNKYNQAQVIGQQYDGGDGRGGELGKMKKRLLPREKGQTQTVRRSIWPWRGAL